MVTMATNRSDFGIGTLAVDQKRHGRIAMVETPARSVLLAGSPPDAGWQYVGKT
jgi:hypothetical protein